MRGKKMSLEEYMNFCESLDGNALTVNYLHHIIFMHGFSKVHGAPKSVLIDAVRTLDLMVPFRSTLKDNISSNAFLTVQEIMEHISTLQWHECSVRSIQTISSGNENLTTEDLFISTFRANATNPKANGKRKSRKDGTLAPSAQSSGNAGNLKPKRDRTSVLADTPLAARASAAPSSSGSCLTFNRENGEWHC